MVGSTARPGALRRAGSGPRCSRPGGGSPKGSRGYRSRSPIGVAIALQLLLDDRVANHPKWVLPAIAFLLLVGIVAANPKRIDSQSKALRATTLLLIAS